MVHYDAIVSLLKTTFLTNLGAKFITSFFNKNRMRSSVYNHNL